MSNSKNILVVVDMQNDFVTGSLGSKDAENIVDGVVDKVQNFDGEVIFTRDTHQEEYLQTNEGKYLPVEHCIYGSHGWEIVDELEKFRSEKDCKTLDKGIFGSYELMDYLQAKYNDNNLDSVTFVGLCTDVCVVSNAIMLRSAISELPIFVESKLCAGTSPENHEAALKTMQSCNISVE